MVKLADDIWAQRDSGITNAKAVESVENPGHSPMNGKRW